MPASQRRAVLGDAALFLARLQQLAAAVGDRIQQALQPVVPQGCGPIRWSGSQVAICGNMVSSTIASTMHSMKGRALKDGRQGDIRRDAVDDVQIEAHRRRNQSDFHVDGHDDAEPDGDRNRHGVMMGSRIGAVIRITAPAAGRSRPPAGTC
jgi:hypothetical protein